MTRLVCLLSTHCSIQLRILSCHLRLSRLPLWQSCFLQSVSLTQRTSPLLFCPPPCKKSVTLSYDARWELTLCWQAMTATNAARKHEVLCLNELPYRLEFPSTCDMSVTFLISLLILVLTSACACHPLSIIVCLSLFFFPQMFSLKDHPTVHFISS